MNASYPVRQIDRAVLPVQCYSPGETELFKMVLLKLAYVTCVLSAATAVSDVEEFRYFGGLLFGSLLSAAAGVSMLLMSGQPVLRQIIVARLLGNSVFGVGLGAILVQLGGHWNIHTGPLFTVAAGFLAGIAGVGLVKLCEPILKRRAEAAVEKLLDRAMPDELKAANTATVRLAPETKKIE